MEMKSSLKIFVLLGDVPLQKIYELMKVFSFLSLSLSLLVLGSCDIQWLLAVTRQDFIIFEFDNGNGIFTPVMFDNIFVIFEGNSLNLANPFEHTVEIDADQIFPNETLKREIVSDSGPLKFTMPTLKYNLLGFNISATDIEVNASAKQITDDTDQINNTRIDFPVMLARNVNVSNGIIIKNFNNVDLSSIYTIYDPKTDKFTFHVPFGIAAKHLLKD
jgi:hypothetical protein